MRPIRADSNKLLARVKGRGVRDGKVYKCVNKSRLPGASLQTALGVCKRGGGSVCARYVNVYTNRFAWTAALTRLPAGAKDVRSGRQGRYEMPRRCVYQMPATPARCPSSPACVCSCALLFALLPCALLLEKWAADACYLRWLRASPWLGVGRWLRVCLWLRVSLWRRSYLQAGAPLGPID